MIDIVILAKLVPDIRHIPPDAWDLDRGTLRRNRLHLVPNPLDDRALQIGVRIKEAWGGRITVISMGPPGAKELCSRALAFGADRAILVSDPACAGSDTLATSRTLAAAIVRVADRRSVPPSVDQTLVLAGVQSPDGDTAQVPIQVAAFLGMRVLPYVTSAGIESARLNLKAISGRDSATATVERHKLPLLITCTDQLEPLPFYTSLDGLARAASATVEHVTASDLNLGPHDVGLAGSATRVVKISGSPAARRHGELVRWNSRAAKGGAAGQVWGTIAATLSANSSSSSPAHLDPMPPKAIGGNDEVDGQRENVGASNGTLAGAVWVLTADDGGDLGLISEARRIADAKGCAAVACFVDSRHVTAPKIIAQAGATRVLIVGVGSATGEPDADPRTVALALEEAVQTHHPSVLLIPATPEGRVIAPYLAARIGAGLTADCTGFAVTDLAMRRSGKRITYHDHLHQIRPALGGNILATIVSPANVDRGLPQIATVRPGVFPQLEWLTSDLPIDRFSPRMNDRLDSLPLSRTKCDPSTSSPDISIESCAVLVSVGRGAGGPDGIRRYAEPLAAAIQERFAVEAGVSASRAVVDAGHAERRRQVGQTGVTVRPDLYIALGISGAIQHRAGMEESGVIIAVNGDEDAPIRQFCDVFVHGRVEEVVPQLIASLTEEIHRP